MDCLTAMLREEARKRRRQLRVNEEAHLGCSDDGMIDGSRGVFERGRNVLGFEIREVIEDLAGRRAPG